MNKIFTLLAIAILASWVIVNAQSKPPARYVDRGACPFECCTYRAWRTEKTTVGYAKPSKRSKRVGVYTAGSNVVGVTGEVRTVPGKFIITKPHGKYKPSDVLWVCTPLGEGFYKVWFRGRMSQEALDYMNGPYEQSHPTCDETPNCWGRLQKPMRVEWWVKIKSASGWVGWTHETENFSNMDARG